MSAAEAGKNKKVRRETEIIMVQKRKKAQFNLIDALIIIIILALISAAAYLIWGGFNQMETSGDIDFTFEVRISGVKENMLPYIKEDSSVKDSVTGETLGTIVGIRMEKSRYYGSVQKDENGDYVLSATEYPDEYDVYVTISARSKADERGIYEVGNVRMLIGETVHFQVKSFSAVSHIVNTDFTQADNSEDNSTDNSDETGNA